MPGLTPRQILQQWGTEVCRDSFHKDIWIHSLERKLGSGNYVIPDTRFPNEINLIKRNGGQVWRVRRGRDPAWFSRYRRDGKEPKDIHPSEWAWARNDFDLEIANAGTLDDLKENIIRSL
jgi:hypothetical protein